MNGYPFLYKLLIVIGAYIVSLFGGHIFTKLVLRRFRFPEYKGGIEKAGEMIGYLERVLILSFILLRAYELIGFVVMAKSIARFEELKNRPFAEYFLIGTLSSTLIAVLVGIIMLKLL